jgi:uncharacterized sulfatase
VKRLTSIQIVFVRTIVTHGRDFNPAHASPVWKSWCEKAKTDAHAAQRVRLYQHRPPEELYNVQADSYELKNLAADPAQRDLKNMLSWQLDDWMAQQGDEGLETEMTVPLYAPQKVGEA